jgi:hypothetical protein
MTKYRKPKLNIKTDFREVGCEAAGWMKMVRNCVQWLGQCCFGSACSVTEFCLFCHPVLPVLSPSSLFCHSVLSVLSPSSVCSVTQLCLFCHPVLSVLSLSSVCSVTKFCLFCHPVLSVQSPSSVCSVTQFCLFCHPVLSVLSPNTGDMFFSSSKSLDCVRDHPSLMGSGNFSPGVKSTGPSGQPQTSIHRQGNEWVELSLHASMCYFMFCTRTNLHVSDLQDYLFGSTAHSL